MTDLALGRSASPSRPLAAVRAVTPAGGWLSLALVLAMCLVLAAAMDDARIILNHGEWTDFLVWAAVGGVLIGSLGPTVGWGRWTTYLVGSVLAALVMPLFVGASMPDPATSPAGWYTDTAGAVWNSVVDLVPTDGGPTRRIPANSAKSPMFRPPDGRQLVFRGLGDDGLTWGFYLFDVAVEGAQPVRLDINGVGLEGRGYDLNAPAWAPTGDRLAYHSLVPLPLSVGHTNGFRIFVASIDEAGTVSGTLPLEMDPTSDDEMVPVFSQDGRSLVFQQRFGLLGVNDYTDSAWIVGADGTAPRPLGVQTSNGEGFVVSVAPDDTQVLVHLNTERQDWIVPRDGSPAARTDLESDDGAGWRREAS